MKKILVSWSGGKDSAWALHLLTLQPGIRIEGLLTTFDEAGCVPVHGIPRALVEEQAARAGLPLWPVELPAPCSNAVYEERLRPVWRRAVSEGISAVAFGDLFLADIRRYREEQLRGTGLEALFPLWGLPTEELARKMIAGGLRARVVSVDPVRLPDSFVGRGFDAAFLDELPEGIDACGENGEFHTFVCDVPCFAREKPLSEDFSLIKFRSTDSKSGILRR